MQRALVHFPITVPTLAWAEIARRATVLGCAFALIAAGHALPL